MMAKYKAKKYINHYNSFNGLDEKDWKKLNADHSCVQF